MRCFVFLLLGFITMVRANANPTCIAHRGACGYEPENTLRSFAKAIELGAQIIECDVRLTKDNELVIIHDSTIDRTTNGKGLVKNFTLAELKEFDAGKGEHIPTLQELCNVINNKAILNIELKEFNMAQPVAAFLIKYFELAANPKNFLISSFNHIELKRFHELCPMVEIAVLLGDLPIDCKSVVDLVPAKKVGLYKEYVTREVIEQLHEEGMYVFVYTVDDANEIAALAQIGVDSICTNFPDRVVNYVGT